MFLLWRFITKRRTLIYLKYLSFALICCLYFIILFRETITAIEFTKVQRNLHNKNKNEITDHHQKQLIITPATTNTKQKYINLFNQRYINKRTKNYSNQQFNNVSITIINSNNKILATKRTTKLKKKIIKKLVKTIISTSTTTTTTTTPKSIPTTINSIYEYSEELNTLAEKDFNQRKKILNNICLKYKNITELSPNAWEFFISPGHGIAWCNVFKAASSTWLYYFNILGGYNIGFLQRTRSSPLELARKHFPRPNQYELQDALQQSLSFLIVREPFERLLSAYRNKLEGYRNKYYKILGEKIVKKFRKNKYLKKITLTGPTFKEFLLFLIQNYKNGEHFDEHWTPIYRFCTPCSINYTLIAKLETFQRDSEYIIRQTGLETLLLNKLPKKRKKSITNQSINNTKNLTQRYFSEIDEKILNDLYEIYGPDFELFDYNITKYYDIVKAKQNKQQSFNKLLTTTTSTKSKTSSSSSSSSSSSVKLIEKYVSNKTTETIK